MALVTGISFKLYDDSGLTTESSTSLQLTHYTDLSDGNQDSQYYFGSVGVNRILKASSNPGVDNITITPTYILPDFVASAAYSLGDKVRPTTPNGYIYNVTQAGTAAAAPSWPTGAVGDTIVTGGVIFELYAEDRPTTEIKLATTEVGLDGATAGAALTVGTSVSSGSGNAFEFWVRVTNTITTVGSNYGTPELSIAINSVIEEIA